MLSQRDPLDISLAWSLVSFHYYMGKSSWVQSRTQGLFPPVADDIFYDGFCKTCLHPARDED